MAARLTTTVFRHGIFLASYALALAAASLVADERDYHKDRIAFYTNALSNQRRAFGVCAKRVDQLSDAATVSESGEDKAQAERRKSLKKFEKLCDVYHQKIIKTLKLLAGEHEKLAEKQRRMDLHASASHHLISAAKLWERVGVRRGEQAAISHDEGNYGKAGALNKKAYGAFKNAQRRWKKYQSSVVGELGELNQRSVEQNVKLALKDNYYDGIEALRQASNEYYLLYEKYNKTARETAVPKAVEKGKAGEQWLHAASASEKYERSLNHLRIVERNKWTTFNL